MLFYKYLTDEDLYEHIRLAKLEIEELKQTDRDSQLEWAETRLGNLETEQDCR